MNRRTTLKSITATLLAPLAPMLPEARAAAPLVRASWSVPSVIDGRLSKNVASYATQNFYTIQEALDYIGKHKIEDANIRVPEGHTEPKSTIELACPHGTASCFIHFDKYWTYTWASHEP